MGFTLVMECNNDRLESATETVNSQQISYMYIKLDSLLYRGILWPTPHYTPGYMLDGGILWPVTPV